VVGDDVATASGREVIVDAERCTKLGARWREHRVATAC